MNSIYTDRLYDDLDFISQATEPFIDNLENLYFAFPEALPIGPELIKTNTYKNTNHFYIDTERIYKNAISRFIHKMSEENKKYRTELSDLLYNKEYFNISSDLSLSNCFDNVEIDLFTGETSVPIYLVRSKDFLNKDDIKSYALRKISTEYRYKYFNFSDKTSMDRAIELYDIFNVERTSKTRKKNKLGLELGRAILHKIENDDYRIRTFDLMVKLGEWCKSYVYFGDISAYTNITRFKLMTHSGKAIYSVEESI